MDFAQLFGVQFPALTRAFAIFQMKTDKQVLKIFEACPEWLFELSKTESPGACTFRPFTVKALTHEGDGLAVPKNPKKPLTVVEFQFQRDPMIYPRIVTEMAAVQKSYDLREVQGFLFFSAAGLDPQTRPWNQVVRAYVLRDLLDDLERRNPSHPLVAVFKPLLELDEATLEKRAIRYYGTIKKSNLKPEIRDSLLDVFVSWLEQRLTHKKKREIEIMLIGELPSLEETQSGKDLIRIGEKRGEARGKKLGLDDAILVFLEAKHGRISRPLRAKIESLSPEMAKRLLAYLPKCETLDEIKKWLGQSAKA